MVTNTSFHGKMDMQSSVSSSVRLKIKEKKRSTLVPLESEIWSRGIGEGSRERGGDVVRSGLRICTENRIFRRKPDTAAETTTEDKERDDRLICYVEDTVSA